MRGRCSREACAKHQGPQNHDKIIVIGVGNAFRTDDGVGIAVARALMRCAPPRVPVIEATGEGTTLMDAWKGYESVILIDAARSGSVPGTVFRLDPHEQTIPSRFFHYSTHVFSVAEAVEMARTLASLPPRFVLYAIEGGNFDHGTELTPKVREAAGRVTALVLDELGSGHSSAVRPGNASAQAAT
ncbi:MAG: hydrogenase maturation protease [bacterium]